MSKVRIAATRFAGFLSASGAGRSDFLAPGVVVRRFGFDAERGTCVEVITGLQGVRDWAARSPEGTFFDVAEATDERADQARYVMRVKGFIGGGLWRLELDDDGRSAALEHHPDDLDADRQNDAEWREAVELTLRGRRD